MPPFAPKLIGFVMLSTVVLMGCDPKTAPVGTFVPDAKSIGAHTAPPSKAVLLLDGSRFDVDLVSNDTGKSITIDLKAHNEVLDTERYQSDESSFDLVEASGLMLNPPIPLVKYGTFIGNNASWTGQIQEADIKLDASANIRTSESVVNVGEVSHDAVQIDVDLTISQTKDQKLSRRLILWVTPDLGIVKRAFGSSIREPAK